MSETSQETLAADPLPIRDDAVRDTADYDTGDHDTADHDRAARWSGAPAAPFDDEPRLPRVDEPVAPVEIFCNSFTTANPEKLKAIAGVMSAYNRHLAGVAGVAPDALEGEDVQRLGRMIGALIGLDHEPRQRGRQPARPRVSG